MKKLSPILCTMVDAFIAEEPTMAEKNKVACQSEYGFVQQPGKIIPFLRPQRLAELLGISMKTLERLRKSGSGPAFVRISNKHIRYPITELEKWIRSCLCTYEDDNEQSSNLEEKL